MMSPMAEGPEPESGAAATVVPPQGGSPEQEHHESSPQLIIQLPQPAGPQSLADSLLAQATAALALGAVPLGILGLARDSVPGGLIQTWWKIWLACGLMSIATALGALAVVRALYARTRLEAGQMSATLRRCLTFACVGAALIPCLCSVSGAALLPPVKLCSPKFFYPQNGMNGGREEPGYMDGNLIGSTSQWIYIAQFSHHGFRTITAVPAGAVQLQAIGPKSGCGDVTGR
jgi:hypothetical protein